MGLSHDKRRKWNLEKIQQLAIQKGGQCISDNYLGYQMPLEWVCLYGHTWKSKLTNVASKNRWCPHCAPNRRLVLNDIQNKAIKNAGVCVSKSVENGSLKFVFKCDQNHVFKASGYKIMGGQWCPLCAKNAKINYSDIIKDVKKRGGTLISAEYKSKSKLNIRCSNNHVFSIYYSKLKHRYQWCPRCSYKSLSEEICRELLEAIFNKPFPSFYPKWLKNGVNQMELDGYNSELGIAFEHQGIQHYDAESYNKMCKGKDLFENLKSRDELKKRLCAENNVKLIEIPSVFNILGMNNLCDFVSVKLKNAGLLAEFVVVDIDIDEICCNILSRRK